MKRGEIWTLRDEAFASKARPVLVLQNDDHDGFDSIILCLFTTYDSSTISTRVLIEPTNENGLKKTCFVMTDKIVTVDRTILGRRIGFLDTAQMDEVSRQVIIILSLN